MASSVYAPLVKVCLHGQEPLVSQGRLPHPALEGQIEQGPVRCLRINSDLVHGRQDYA